MLAHEVPHHIGDLVVLRNSKHRNLALLKVSLAGAVTALGGICGYFLVGHLEESLPYFLVVASSSFVYVALSDLIPQLQKRLSAKESLVQVAWLVTGIVLVTLDQWSGAWRPRALKAPHHKWHLGVHFYAGMVGSTMVYAGSVCGASVRRPH